MIPKIGLQLYSIKDILDTTSFVSVLEEVRKMGYTGVEAVERDGDPDTVHTFCGKAAKEVRDVLDDLDLTVISSHVGFDDLQRQFDEITDYHRIIGCDTLVIAGIPEKFFRDRKTIRETVAELNRVGARVKERGFDFAFHNCPFNFIDPLGYTLFAEEVDEALALQPDSGNAAMVQVDPSVYFGGFSNRFVSLHIKDAKRGSDVQIPLDRGLPGEEGMQHVWAAFEDLSVPVGKGDVDIGSFVRLGMEREAPWLIVEEEMAPDPLATVRAAYDHLAALVK